MRPRPLFWQLFPTYCLLTVFALLVIIVYFSRAVEQFYFEQTSRSSAERIALIEPLFSAALAANDSGSVDSLARSLGAIGNMRITVLLPSGRVIADSHKNYRLMDNHANRPEVRRALDDSVGASSRFSHTVDKTMQYSARLLRHNGEIAGVLRAAVPIDAIRQSLAGLQRRIVLVGVVLVLFTALVSLGISRYLSRGIEQLQRGAEHFARGELAVTLSVSASREMQLLARAMNHMAVQLGERLQTITSQRNEQEAILESMTEGVLAVGPDERIINLNRPAGRIVGCEPEAVRGKLLQEAVRNSDIQQAIATLLRTRKGIEKQMSLVGIDGSERFLQLHGTVLRDGGGSPAGALLVMNDITQIKRLEEMRTNFVANVSHELRTPLTSIKGFVETLLAGARDNPEDTERFLRIIDKHAERLKSIIEDILSLSLIEKEAERDEIELVSAALRPVCLRAVEVCLVGAQRRKVQIALECEEQVLASINAALLEQALINLLDNAVKYGREGSTVRLEVSAAAGECRIAVHDQGPGIEPRHIPRLFERFYRIDKSRSRTMGGTGLGLSIVKHIVSAHRGTVQVSSTPGVGSTFTVVLPG